MLLLAAGKAAGAGPMYAAMYKSASKADTEKSFADQCSLVRRVSAFKRSCRRWYACLCRQKPPPPLRFCVCCCRSLPTCSVDTCY